MILIFIDCPDVDKITLATASQFNSKAAFINQANSLPEIRVLLDYMHFALFSLFYGHKISKCVCSSIAAGLLSCMSWQPGNNSLKVRL